MPTLLPHLIAGCSMFIIGKYYFKRYFNSEDKNKEQFLLLLVCLSLSFVPDLVLISYFLTIYTETRTSPPDIVFMIHSSVHIALFLIAIGFLIGLKYKINVKREPIWIMGMLSIILHVLMDLFIPEYGIWY